MASKEFVRGVEDIDAGDLITLGDRVDDVLAFGHMAEDRVLVIEMWRRTVRDEELAAIGLRTSICHGEDAWLVVLQVRTEFVFELVAWAARACARGITALDHEIGDDAVKRDAIVVTALGEIEETRHRDWNIAAIEGRFDISLVSFQDNVDIRHGSMPRSEFSAAQPQVLQMITRFAPSPTGNLHLGHAYAAWVAWKAARDAEGQFLLRWEDIDGPRCRPEYERSTLEDLDWLGLAPDEASMRQSERLSCYSGALEMLRARDLLYPCFCTRRDIAQSGGAPHGPDGPIYPGLCRKLPAQETARRLAEGEAPAWRLKMDLAVKVVGPLTWEDTESGQQQAQPELFGDVVLARKDIATSYHLAVTVDDAEQGITVVTRGKDLFEATHIHRLLQALLDLPVPKWHHHRLICDTEGKRLAKRDAATTLQTLREGGVTPEEIRRRLGVRLE